MPDGAVYNREIGDVIKQHRGHRERDASRLDGWQVAGLQTNSVQRADLYFRHSFEIGARQTRHAVPHRSSPFRSDRIKGGEWVRARVYLMNGVTFVKLSCQTRGQCA